MDRCWSTACTPIASCPAHLPRPVRARTRSERTAAGLSAQKLTGINLLVTKYGQTDDPVQAAAVGWAVKAIANLSETLHHFGYQGDSLAEAIHWTFSALAPEHSAEVQRLAVMYYDEARAAPVGIAGASGTMVFTADAAEPRGGSVRVDASTAARRAPSPSPVRPSSPREPRR
jgi:hypothetical protein